MNDTLWGLLIGLALAGGAWVLRLVYNRGKQINSATTTPAPAHEEDLPTDPRAEQALLAALRQAAGKKIEAEEAAKAAKEKKDEETRKDPVVWGNDRYGRKPGDGGT